MLDKDGRVWVVAPRTGRPRLSAVPKARTQFYEMCIAPADTWQQECKDTTISSSLRCTNASL
jgi:hypothetical protein